MKIVWPSDLEGWAKFVGMIAAVFGVAKYFLDAESARVLKTREAALEYVAIYGDTELRDHRQSLFEFWLQNADATAYMRREGHSDADYDNFMLTAFTTDPKRRELVGAVYSLANFYDQVALCRSTKICSAEIVDQNFCKGATGFTTDYRPIIALLATGSGADDFAKGARELSALCAPATPSSTPAGGADAS